MVFKVVALVTAILLLLPLAANLLISTGEKETVVQVVVQTHSKTIVQSCGGVINPRLATKFTSKDGRHVFKYIVPCHSA